MCMANTILKQVNDIGAVLGYPFYVYPDGTCGKSIVSGKMNAAIVVKKEFPVKELKADFLGNIRKDDEDVLMHLSKIGEKIGFPFYVYADGNCGTTANSQSDGLPFVMCVKKKFLVEKLLFDVKEVSAAPISLDREEELLRLEKCSDDVIKAYFDQNKLSNAEQKFVLEKCSDKVIKAYFEQNQPSETRQLLMLEKCSDDDIKDTPVGERIEFWANASVSDLFDFFLSSGGALQRDPKMNYYPSFNTALKGPFKGIDSMQAVGASQDTWEKLSGQSNDATALRKAQKKSKKRNNY